METRAPHHTPEAPQGPRNLAQPLAAWLRKLGFVATEQELPHFATVESHWVGPAGERFQFTYTWCTGPVPDATCWLRVLYAGQVQAEPLFTPQKVRRLKELRLLLLGNVRLANARLLLALPAPADF